jgi:hypothetical protein
MNVAECVDPDLKGLIVIVWTIISGKVISFKNA